jgi:dolichyl-phosphate-mannose-protein mannosyltransferase
MAGMAATLQAPVRGTGSRPADRLVQPMPADRLLGWLLPLAVTAVAAFLHFYRLGAPRGLVFDEVYYAHDSYNLLRHGVELNNLNTAAGYIVHPPIGKWMIAAGEALFDHGTRVMSGKVFPVGAFGWRFSAAVVGTLAVLVLARTARRMFRSTLLGTVAGLLLALDGLEFVQSRLSMLDIFVMFWLVAAFGCLVVDRDDGRARLAARLTGTDGRGPWLGLRRWRVAAGVCLGLACATKWNGAYYLPAFVALCFAWDAGARRAAGLPRPRRAALLLDTLPSLATLVLLPVLVYVASWTGWFLGDRLAYDHDLYVRHGQSTLAHAWAVFRGWLTYQHQIYDFHDGLTAAHPYRSEPFGWLIIGRPVSYYYSSPAHACGAAACSAEVLGMGTPAIWWAWIPALLACAASWLRRRDWRAGAVLLGYLAGWLPWVYLYLPLVGHPPYHRTMFFFYALPMLPFMVLGLTYCIGLVLDGRPRTAAGRPTGAAPRRPGRRPWRVGVVTAYLLVVLANFAYLYPILAAEPISYQAWHSRMWLSSCGNTNHHQTNEPCWI